ncbi:hypothetical protein [Deinococcus cellulosilyticus]|uniref:Uncharacterized protein n=1 Tax=Deinococcus cellulosilyticus (strain DSM 18568 / NBRC 106333 / KACC 11606 / 5516J-15) TaxID=1223518 RepID=A0A511N2Z5_DEIC1|nr:hypothetical protein [Deinococcus cellulosilyticus]GEM47223.1 hypothetical protein DC3_28580 [Deinococcus cellulosilyticus NBRC 106333 = KACC 11606]
MNPTKDVTGITQNIDSLAHTAAQTGITPLVVAFMVVLVVLIIFAFIWMVKKAQDGQEKMMARQQATQEQMIGVYQDSLKTLTSTHKEGMSSIAEELKTQGKAIHTLANRMSRIEGRLELEEKEKA